MNTKTCPNCGWVYPNIEAYYTCKFCHTKLTGGICRVCGENSEHLHGGLCTSCESARHAKFIKKRREARHSELEQWLDKIKKIPTPYSTLTEEQWIEACKYFGGCAMCGSDDISTRLMFVDYKDGGRYCAWNIIPACEECATMRKTIHNPFSRMDSTLHREGNVPTKRKAFSLEKLKAITDYLERRMHNDSD